jgi:riboflavin synthase
MFTGIVTGIGVVRAAEDGHFRISCEYDAASIAIGASIACDGCCLTVTQVDPEDAGRSTFHVDVSNETLLCTTLGRWRGGTRINLERSLRLGDEMGGHLVSGHVDGVAEIISITPDGDSKRFEMVCSKPLARFVAAKGSVALDGTSLTVNSVEDNRFTVNIIPHTLVVTTWGGKAVGDPLNMEVDLIARYAERLFSSANNENSK